MSRRSLRGRLRRFIADLASVTSGAGSTGRRLREPLDGEIGVVAHQLNATLDALDDSRRDLADARNFAKLGFWHLDLDNMRVHIPAENTAVVGLDTGLPGQDLDFTEYLGRCVHPEDRDRLRAWAERAKTSGNEEGERGVDFRTVNAAGEVRHLSSACRSHPVERRILFLVARDVSELRRVEDELLRGNLYDPLTGLPNRKLLMERLASRLAHTGTSGKSCTVAILDLDRFGAVKASIGREVGERLLLGLVVRLVGALPPGTSVGRLSYHEFGVLLDDSPEDIDEIARTLCAVARTPLPLEGRELVLTGSVGIASAKPGECLAEELLARCESAVFHATLRGGDVVSYFDEERSRQAKDRVDMEMDLGKAVPDQMELHYQPIVHLSTGKLAGFEALVRWRHPERGLVSPVLFIPIAERSGIIHDIGQWVMEEAMGVEADWQRRMGDAAPFMSINLSVRQFRHDDLSERIRETMLRTGADPRGIKLEITESALTEDPQRVAELLERLCSTGLGFSLDDFGTGYSSLGYLSRFPVQTLKVDKSFVDELGHDEKQTRITSAIVSLAHTLGMEVVAEGIETEIQRERLLALGCEYGQGYLFSKPLHGDKVEEFLSRS
jgi:diguanylate cyclase (GGDEF)-like protein